MRCRRHNSARSQSCTSFLEYRAIVHLNATNFTIVHDDALTRYMARRERTHQSPWRPPERRSFRAGRVLSLSRRNFRATTREKLELPRGEACRARRTARKCRRRSGKRILMGRRDLVWTRSRLITSSFCRPSKVSEKKKHTHIAVFRPVWAPYLFAAYRWRASLRRDKRSPTSFAGHPHTDTSSDDPCRGGRATPSFPSATVISLPLSPSPLSRPDLTLSTASQLERPPHRGERRFTLSVSAPSTVSKTRGHLSSVPELGYCETDRAIPDVAIPSSEVFRKRTSLDVTLNARGKCTRRKENDDYSFYYAI